jgi:MYXO-CTERM domain-containing protein
MKTSLVLGSTLALVLLSTVASAADAYKATLNGAQETPANASAATGSATLSFESTTKTLTGSVLLVGLNGANAQHIHVGDCGVGGGVAHALPAPVGNAIAVNVVLTDGEVTQLVSNKLYINVHTAAFGDGEIRGQIYPAASTAVCPSPDGGTADAGTDAGDGGTSGTSGGTSGTSGGTSGSSGGTSGTSGTSGSNGAVTTPADGGTAAAPADDSGGCSTTGSDANGSGLAMMSLAGLGLALVLRARNRKR